MTPEHLATPIACPYGGVSRERATHAQSIGRYSDLLCLLYDVELTVRQPAPEDGAVVDKAAERVVCRTQNDALHPTATP